MYRYIQIHLSKMDKYSFKYVYDEDDRLFIDYATQKDIDSFTYPSGTKEITVSGDWIDKLVIPEGVERLSVFSTGLRELEVPSTLTYLVCDGNLLKRIHLPQKIENVSLASNRLESVSFEGENPTHLITLDLDDNSRIESLDFTPPPSMLSLNIRFCHGLHIGHLNPALLKIAIDCLNPFRSNIWC